MGIPPGKRGHIGSGSVYNAGIYTDASGNHCGVHCNMPDLLVLYWGGSDARVQSDPELVGAGPHLGGGGKQIQLRGID